MSAKTEGITQTHIDFSLLSFIRCKIQFRIYFRIQVYQVDGGRYHTIDDGHDHCNGLNGSGSAKQMTGHRFGGADI